MKTERLYLLRRNILRGIIPPKLCFAEASQESLRSLGEEGPHWRSLLRRRRIKFQKWFQKIDPLIAGWMNAHGYILLRYSLAIVFIWFGALKFTGISPANELVARTVYWFPAEVFIPVLGLWEVAIGVCLLIRPLIRVALFLLFLQMPGTMLPLFILSDVCYTQFPFGLTLEGQYIIKNLVLISAGIVIGGTVRNDN